MWSLNQLSHFSEKKKKVKYLITCGWVEPLLHSGSSWAWNPSVLSLSPLPERFLLLEPNPAFILGEIIDPLLNSVAFPVICQDSNWGGNSPPCFSHHWRRVLGSNFRIFLAVLQWLLYIQEPPGHQWRGNTFGVNADLESSSHEDFMESQDHGMLWVGKDLKAHPCHVLYPNKTQFRHWSGFSFLFLFYPLLLKDKTFHSLTACSENISVLNPWIKIFIFCSEITTSCTILHFFFPFSIFFPSLF